MEKALPAIPAKRYFTIGEVSELCGVKPYVLRYWEQEFAQLKPMKRRGNRRYYQHHEVLLIRRIRDLLYEQGFTISGARNRLSELAQGVRHEPAALAFEGAMPAGPEVFGAAQAPAGSGAHRGEGGPLPSSALAMQSKAAAAQRYPSFASGAGLELGVSQAATATGAGAEAASPPVVEPSLPPVGRGTLPLEAGELRRELLVLRELLAP